jgi:Ca-activated chloride channel homolog
VRTRLLGLVVAAIVLGACAAAASPAGTNVPPPDYHHYPTVTPIYPYPSAPYPTVAPQPVPAGSPYDGVTFDNPGVNPYVDPARDDESTFALDVDTASYSVARRYVADGNLPDPNSIRVEEWVNGFDQGYAPPREDTFAIHVDGGPSPFLPSGELLVRVGIQAREADAEVRPDASLTLVIDTSGSMAIESRLETVKDALRFLADRLGRNDRVAIVTFGDDARIVLDSTRATDRSRILAAIDELQPGGSTNAEAGLRLGYVIARRNLVEGGVNRVVLASDGVANVGLTDADAILGAIARDAAAGIELVSVGVGMGNFNDALLEKLADHGHGFYAYVNGPVDARQLFGERLAGTVATVARDAKVRVVFDPGAVSAYRLVGYENRAIPDGAFRDDQLPAGTITAGHASTALYAVRLRGNAAALLGDGPETAAGSPPIAAIRLRWADPATGQAAEQAATIRPADLRSSFEATAPEFRLDALAAGAAEVYRRSDISGAIGPRDVAAIAGRLAGGLPRTEEARGLVELIDRVARIDP